MDKEGGPVSITVVGLNGKIMLRLQGPITADEVAEEVHELHHTMAIEVQLFDDGLMLKPRIASQMQRSSLPLLWYQPGGRVGRDRQ